MLNEDRARGEQPERPASPAHRALRGDIALSKASATKIGILSGTFDPVHAGHLALALGAIEAAGLDEVYLIPESRPRRKEGVTHYAHRVAMLKLALKPYKKLKLLELPDKQFSVNKTLPRLKKIFPGAELFILVGSDTQKLMTSKNIDKEWPDLDKLLSTIKIIAAVRGDESPTEVAKKFEKLQPGAVVFVSHRPLVSSSDIRAALHHGKSHNDVLPSIKKYIKANWLYAAVR